MGACSLTQHSLMLPPLTSMVMFFGLFRQRHVSPLSFLTQRFAQKQLLSTLTGMAPLRMIADGSAWQMWVQQAWYYNSVRATTLVGLLLGIVALLRTKCSACV